MKNPLVTREGYESLKEELDYLWRVERREVTAKVTWAAGLGDRSENADYQYNKKRLREIICRFLGQSAFSGSTILRVRRPACFRNGPVQKGNPKAGSNI